MPSVTHKFGGSSLADAGRIRGVVDLLLARADERQVVVVSAMKGSTDQLITLAELASRRDPRLDEAFATLRRRHLDVARSLLAERADALLASLTRRFDELRDLLHALALLEDAPASAVEMISGLGEVWCAEIVAAHLADRGAAVRLLDAREVLRITHGELGPRVDWESSRRLLGNWLGDTPWERLVVTGYVAREDRGRITTLGRNGSDWSASIFAALLDAEEVQIWTDVEGVLSADPRLVPEAQVLPALSYEEAFELAYFGAKVIHPQTMTPAAERGLPVTIRSTFAPHHPGTRISAEHVLSPPVKGISSIDDLALITVEGAGMIGVPGTAERVFAALKAARVSVVMISQGSSEHSICCVVHGAQAEGAVTALRQAFAAELRDQSIAAIDCQRGISVLAVVGDGMAGQPGTAARLFAALGRAGVNIRAIAQGASERNISVAIDGADVPKAVLAVHGGFYLSSLTIAVGVIGTGQVGRALLRQIAEAHGRLAQEAHLDLRLVAVANSRHVVAERRGIGWDEAATGLAGSGQPLDLDGFADLVQDPHIPHALIVDCSAADAVAARVPAWLARGIHVVTPNKRLGAGPLAAYRDTRRLIAAGRARFRYEATVGAGLPVISTLRDLIDTGDEVLVIEGILSGTLAWLFHRHDGSVGFAELVAQARALGYTEPDPRDDLSGMDVARKLAILAREMGLMLELSDVEVESLVPADLHAGDVESFLTGLSRYDEHYAARLAQARARGKVLRYVARLSAEGEASVRLAELAQDHPFAHLALTDNVVAFTTRRYRDNPLIVRGPGAGPEVTAAGVFADLLRIAATLGARL